jgi:ABC-type transport system involved in multi-copper enzyme maturation permease subunit
MKSSLFGPVLWFDLVRTARRGRFVWGRVIYLGILLLFLYLLYREHIRRAELNGVGLDVHELANVGTSFFGILTLTQFLVVFLAAPIYAGSALAEEKERGTLEFLLATDLRNREIVLSKLLSRLANMTMLVLTGLPVLSLVQFLGGVDPDLVLLTYLGTTLLALSLASLSLLVSLYCRTAWDAVVRAYIVAGGLITLTFIFGRARAPSWNLGNPALAAMTLMESLGSSGDPTQVLIEVTASYTLCHLALSLVCCTWALLWLRAVALKTAAPPAPKPGANSADRADDLPLFVSRRPPVSDRPLLWKELHEGKARRKSAWSLLLSVVGFALLAIALIFLPDHTHFPRLAARDWEELGRMANTLVICFTLFMVGVGAAGRLSREIEKQTLDTLLTLPERDDIMYSKWLASLLRVRPVLWFLVPLWLLALATGATHPICLLLLLLGCATYAVFLASLGLWFSTVCRSTVRATLMTFVSYTVGLIVLYLLLKCLEELTPLGNMNGTRELLRVSEFVIFPPTVLWELFVPLRRLDLDRDWGPFVRGVTILLCSWILYALFAWMLYAGALVRFRRLAGESGAEAKGKANLAAEVVAR